MTDDMREAAREVLAKAHEAHGRNLAAVDVRFGNPTEWMMGKVVIDAMIAFASTIEAQARADEREKAKRHLTPDWCWDADDPETPHDDPMEWLEYVAPGVGEPFVNRFQWAARLADTWELFIPPADEDGDWTSQEFATEAEAEAACTAHPLHHGKEANLMFDVATVQRFWGKVDKSAGPNACWPYNGQAAGNGYGSFYTAGRYIKAHRFALASQGGLLPARNVFALHSCDNPPCCKSCSFALGLT